MQINVINKARSDFRKWLAANQKTFTARCKQFLDEAYEGLDEGDEWQLCLDKVFPDVVDWLRDGGHSNPAKLKGDMVKAFEMMVVHASTIKTIGGLVAAHKRKYGKKTPNECMGKKAGNRKGKVSNGKAKGGAKSDTFTVAEVQATCQKLGLTKRMAERFVKELLALREAA